MFEFKNNVVYYFDEMIGTYHYANNHPMKPLRVAMTDELVKCYHIDSKLQSIVLLPSCRTKASPNSITSTPRRKPSPPFTPTSTWMSSATSLPKTDPTTKTNSIASISRKTAQSWRDSTTTS